MFLKRLKVENFKSFSHFDIEFSSKKNYIVGENAVGKTSILEAIYFQSLGRSFLINDIKSLISYDKPAAFISITYEKDNKVHTLDSKITRQGKSFEYDNEKLRNNSEVIKLFQTFYFNPQSVYMFKEEPTVRRKLLDIVLCQVKDSYLYALTRYKKILKERNSSLAKSFDQDIIDVLADELVNLSYVIVNERRRVISYINSVIETIYSKIYGQEKKVKVYYKTTSPLIDDKEEFIKEARQLFNRYKSNEYMRKMTIIGPHRDNFSLYIDDKDVSLYASQGENRIAALSLKIALHQYVSHYTKETPVFLLDDILSDLDEKRRINLLATIDEKTQFFITGVNEIELEQYDIYKVKNSNIRRIH